MTGPGTRTGPESREALESLINSLVDRPDSGRNSRSGSPAAKASRPSSLFGTGQLGVGHISDTSPRGTPSRPVSIQTASIATQTLSASAVATNYEVNPAIPVRRPPEVVSYSVGVQTAEPWSPPKRKDSVDGISDSEDEASASTTRSPKAQKRLSRRERDREDELRQNIKRELAEELRALKDPAADGVMTNGTSNRFPVRALTTEEVNALTSSPEFLDSVDRSIKVIERALESEYDVLVDYGLEGADGLDSDDDEGYGSMRGKKGRKIKEVAQFYDEKWSKKRMISDVNFSPKVSRVGLVSLGPILILNIVSRTRPRLIHQESFGSTRPIRSSTSLEPSSTITTRIHLP